MACRSGCATQDHPTYGACCRDSGIRVGVIDASRQKSWDAELAAYRSARSQGAAPATTRLVDIRAALDASDRLGRAYDAGVDPPAASLLASARVLP